MDLGGWIARVPRWARHALFWLVYLVFFSLVYGSYDENYGQEFLFMLLDLPMIVIATYVTMYGLLPLLFKQKYGQFFGLVALILLIAGFVNYSIYVQFKHPLTAYANEPVKLFYPYKIVKFALGIYPIVAIATVIKLLEHWYRNQNTQQQLSQEKLEAELKYLKAQIHPHFLFNTLNNLYALTLKKSDAAPEMVLKLSDLLNYMLYDCNENRVPLDKELKQIENYLALERMRYGDRLDIRYSVNGTVTGHRIAPMLIIAFVENSFKHGTSEELNQAWVNVELEVDEQTITLKVENSKADSAAADDRQYKEGIGLNNVRRRLELLYPERHELKVLDSQDSFLVVLKLEE
ncbi:MAG: histidine kinase [Bacteroidota bacterium]